jgi:hypothetical protein
MLQFFFLSVFLNLAAGLSLSFEAVSRRLPRLAGLTDLLTSRGSKIFSGIGVLIVGFVTLFLPAGGGIIIGDIIPSVAGIAMGIALLFEVFRQDAVFPAERAERTERVEHPLAYRTTLGLLGIATAILHFFLPEKPFF